jgi:hypothetical protein
LPGLDPNGDILDIHAVDFSLSCQFLNHQGNALHGIRKL